MKLYQHKSAIILHEASELVIGNNELKGQMLDEFLNGVAILENNFRKGMADSRDIKESIRHICTFHSAKSAKAYMEQLGVMLCQ